MASLQVLSLGQRVEHAVSPDLMPRARATTSSLVKSAILTSYWKGLATFAQASG